MEKDEIELLDDNFNEYKKKINELSDEQQKERDLYLKRIANGTMQGPLTGYASIDKTWLANYDDNAIKSRVPEGSIYEYFYNSCKDNLEQVLIEYDGREYTARKILENICCVEEILKDKGVKRGDIVSIALPDTPESIYYIYAINKLGAKVSEIDPRQNDYKTKQDLNNTIPNGDVFINLITEKEKTERIMSDTKVTKVIYVSPFESSSSKNITKHIVNFISKLKRLDKEKSHHELMKQKKNRVYDTTDFETFACFDKKETAFILHTGGTTGVHKGVELSNEAINTTVFEHNFLMDGKVNKGDVFLNPLPQFITYGFTSMHLGLSKGFKMILLLLPTSEAMEKAIIERKPRLIFGGPIHWESIINSPKIDKMDLGFIRVPVAGGEKIPLSIKEKVNNFFKEHNCQINLFDGYGLSETTGVFSVAIDDNTVGTVGNPLLFNNLKIVDPNLLVEVPYGVEGEILIEGASMMNQYHNNVSENDRVYVEVDGRKMFRTGDLGKVSESGEISVVGRLKRIFVCGVDKVYQDTMEEVITTLPFVKKCLITKIPDEEKREVPKAHIILEDGYDETEQAIYTKAIEDIVAEKISVNVIPKYFSYDKEFKYTPNGKIDFKLMEEQDLLEYNESIESKRR